MQTFRRTAPILLILTTGALAACGLMDTGKSLDLQPPPTPVSSEHWKEPPKGYLPAGGAPVATKILPDPPAADSAIGRAERETFETTRALKGTPRWTQAIRDADLSGKEGFHSFSCAAGVTISPETTPVLASILMRTLDDARSVYQPPKAVYNRKRPAAGNTAAVCVPREDWIETDGSYPSGHGLVGFGWALIMAELVPDRAAEIVARGRAFGDSRVLCGLHWPSDVEAGRYLAGALVARLHAEPDFQADMAKARTEIEAARALGAPQHCPAA